MTWFLAQDHAVLSVGSGSQEEGPGPCDSEPGESDPLQQDTLI